MEETKIKVSSSDGRLPLYRQTGERANENCIVETQQFRGGSILVWAGILMHTKTQMVRVNRNLNARRYRTNSITPVLLPNLRANRGMIVTQDNSPCHAARTTQQMMHANNLHILLMPACSPDLNLIVHL